MSDFGIAPSEVRKMTPHEIIAIVDLKMQRNKNTKLDEDDYEELYQIYLEATDGCN